MNSPNQEWFLKAEVDRITHTLEGVGASQKAEERVLIPLFKFFAKQFHQHFGAAEIAKTLIPSAKDGHGRQVIHKRVNRLRAFLKRYNRTRRRHRDFFVEIDLPRQGKKYQLTYKSRVENSEWGAFPFIRVSSPQTWGPFRWQCAAGEIRVLPIQTWLPPSREGSLDINFKELKKPWEPPKCKDYERHRKETLARIRKKNPQAYDGNVWRVADVIAHEPGSVEIVVQEGNYLDYFATNLSCSEKICLDTGEQVTIDEWLGARRKDGLLQDIYPGGNTLAVNVLLTTKDDQAVLVQCGKNHAIGENWMSSVSGTFDLTDSKSLHKEARRPDHKRAAYNTVKDELGIEVDPDKIKWVAFVIGLKFGSPCLFGELKVNMSEHEISEQFNKRKDQDKCANRHFTELSAERILPILDERTGTGEFKFQHQTYFELGLAIGLIRRKKAKLLSIGPDSCLE